MAAYLILGGSGPTGRLIARQAIDAGHRVTVLSRHPGQVGFTNERLTLVTGDATEEGVVARALPGHDAVFCALGRGMSFRSEHLMARAVARIIPAMEQGGPRRLVHLSSFGIHPWTANTTFPQRLFFGTLLRGIAEDKAVSDAAVSRSALDWTIVAPVSLSNAPEAAPYRVGERLEVSGLPMMPRASVAEFMLRCAGDPATARKRLELAP